MIASAQLARFRSTYRAGDTAPVSGLYMVSHAKQHRASHASVILQGDVLPSCRTCKDKVTFTLDQTVEYLLHDMDFAGPELLK